MAKYAAEAPALETDIIKGRRKVCADYVLQVIAGRSEVFSYDKKYRGLVSVFIIDRVLESGDSQRAVEELAAEEIARVQQFCETAGSLGFGLQLDQYDLLAGNSPQDLSLNDVDVQDELALGDTVSRHLALQLGNERRYIKEAIRPTDKSES